MLPSKLRFNAIQIELCATCGNTCHGLIKLLKPFETCKLLLKNQSGSCPAEVWSSETFPPLPGGATDGVAFPRDAWRFTPGALGEGREVVRITQGLGAGCRCGVAALGFTSIGKGLGVITGTVLRMAPGITRGVTVLITTGRGEGQRCNWPISAKAA